MISYNTWHKSYKNNPLFQEAGTDPSKLVIAKDVSSKGVKEYCVLDDRSNLDAFLCHTSNEQPHLYEVLFPGTKVCLYLDIDMDPWKMVFGTPDYPTESDFADYTQLIIQETARELKRRYDITITRHSLLDSTRSELVSYDKNGRPLNKRKPDPSQKHSSMTMYRFSAHITFPEIVFDSTVALKRDFIPDLLSALRNSPALRESSGKFGGVGLGIDDSVYKTSQCWRLGGSCKYGKGTPLLPPTPSPQQGPGNVCTREQNRLDLALSSLVGHYTWSPTPLLFVNDTPYQYTKRQRTAQGGSAAVSGDGTSDKRERDRKTPIRLLERVETLLLTDGEKADISSSVVKIDSRTHNSYQDWFRVLQALYNEVGVDGYNVALEHSLRWDQFTDTKELELLMKQQMTRRDPRVNENLSRATLRNWAGQQPGLRVFSAKLLDEEGSLWTNFAKAVDPKGSDPVIVTRLLVYFAPSDKTGADIFKHVREMYVNDVDACQFFTNSLSTVHRCAHTLAIDDELVWKAMALIVHTYVPGCVPTRRIPTHPSPSDICLVSKQGGCQAPEAEPEASDASDPSPLVENETETTTPALQPEPMSVDATPMEITTTTLPTSTQDDPSPLTENETETTPLVPQPEPMSVDATPMEIATTTLPASTQDDPGTPPASPKSVCNNVTPAPSTASRSSSTSWSRRQTPVSLPKSWDITDRVPPCLTDKGTEGVPLTKQEKLYVDMICTVLLHINPTPENHIVAAPAFKALVPENIASPFLTSWAWMMPKPDCTDFADIIPMSDRLAAEKLLLALSEDDPSHTNFSMPDDILLRKEPTVTEWCKSCDPLKSSWAVKVCMATKMFPNEKEKVLVEIEDLFKAVECAPSDFLDFGRSVWDRFGLSRNPYFDTLFSMFTDTKLAGSGYLIESYNECLGVTGRGLEIHPTCMAVRTGGRSMLYGWLRGFGGGTCELFAMHLSTLRVHMHWGGMVQRDLFPTSTLAVTGFHKLYTMRKKFLRSIMPQICSEIPLRFDRERGMWRAYDHRYGIWLLQDQVIKDDEGVGNETPKMAAEYVISSILNHTTNTLGFLGLLSQDRKDREMFFDKLELLEKELVRLSQKDFSGENLLAVFQGNPYLRSSFHHEPKHILSVINGLVDLRTGELIELTEKNEREVRAYNLILENHVHRVYYPELDTTIIDEFFMEHMFRGAYDEPEDVLTLFRQFKGSVLTGERASKILILYGQGSNMKSILVVWDETVLGQTYMAKLDQDDLGVRNNMNNDNVYYSARCRSWYASEFTKAKKLNTALIKQITSGEGYGTVMAKHKTVMRFPPEAKLQLYTNNIPEFDDNDAFSVQKRCIMLHCKYCYYDSSNARQKLIDDGISKEFLRPADPDFFHNKALPLSDNYFTWMVRGAGEWYKEHKCYKIPACLQMKELCTEEVSLERRLSSFVASYLKVTQADQRIGLPVAWILYVFRAWCAQEGTECKENDNAILKALKNAMALFYRNNGKPSRGSIKTRLGSTASGLCGFKVARFSGYLYTDVFWNDLVWENDHMLMDSKGKWK